MSHQSDKLGLLSRTNQIGASKRGATYVRRFASDLRTAIFLCSSVKQERVFIYWPYFAITRCEFYADFTEDFMCGFLTEKRSEFVILVEDRSL